MRQDFTFNVTKYYPNCNREVLTMFRKVIALSVAALFLLSVVSAQPTTDLTAVDKTGRVEKLIYGTEQTGSLLERINKLEKDVYGNESKEALIAKADKLYGYAQDNSVGNPSLITRLNAIEWILTHNQTGESVKVRLENLEKLLAGTPSTGSIDGRLTKLGKMAFTSGQPEIETVEIAKDTLIKIKLTTALDTRSSRVGDSVIYQASEDVYVNGLLVIAKGALGSGKITRVERAQNFGRDAKLEINFEYMGAVDGTVLATFLGEKAKEETASMAKAAGATMVGLVVLGPVGIVGGAFVHGQEITVPAGAEMFIQTKEISPVYGMKTK